MFSSKLQLVANLKLPWNHALVEIGFKSVRDTLFFRVVNSVSLHSSKSALIRFDRKIATATLKTFTAN